MPSQQKAVQLVVEKLGDDTYEYYPLGEYVVAAPGVCGGRPTFKGTRLEAQVVIDLIASGWDIPRVVKEYHRSGITSEAVQEALRLAGEALRAQSKALAA